MKLTVAVDKVSGSAEEKIVAAGGSVKLTMHRVGARRSMGGGPSTQSVRRPASAVRTEG